MADNLSYFPGRGRGAQPPDGGESLEARVAKLESDVSHIKDDIKEIKRDIRIILAVALGAYVAIAGSHILLSEKMERQTDRIERAINAKMQPAQGRI